MSICLFIVGDSQDSLWHNKSDELMKQKQQEHYDRLVSNIFSMIDNLLRT